MTTTLKRGEPGDQTVEMRRDTIPACYRCKHPAVWHGRALPHCDACGCAGYETWPESGTISQVGPSSKPGYWTGETVPS